MRIVGAEYAGLVLAPALWALNTQLGQILPYADCSQRSMTAALASTVCAVLATACALLTLRAWSRTPSRSARFISAISWLAGFAFAFALFQQGAAAVLIPACLH